MEDARTQGRSEKAGHAHGEMGCNRGSIVQGLPTQGNTPELFGSLLPSFCPIQLETAQKGSRTAFRPACRYTALLAPSFALTSLFMALWDY